MHRKQYLVFFIAIALIGAVMTWLLFFTSIEKTMLNIKFVEKDTFKVGEDIEPLSLVESSSSTNILFPKIDTSRPGEKDLLYIAIGEHGEQKEFMKTIYIISPEPPVLKLTKDNVEIFKGKSFEPKKFIKEAADKFDGNILNEVKISGSYDTKTAGTYKITYELKNTSGMKTSKVLTLHVKEEKKTTIKKETKKEQKNDSSNSHNVPETGTENKVEVENKPLQRTTWMFSEGYTFQSALNECSLEGSSSGGTWRCDVIYQGDIAVGYQLKR